MTEAKVNLNDEHYIISFDDAHISIANNLLNPDITKEKLNSQDKVTSLFEKDAQFYLGSPLKGRLGWNGMPAKLRMLSQLAERRHRPYHEKRGVAIQHLRGDDARSTFSTMDLWPHPAPISETRLSGVPVHRLIRVLFHRNRGDAMTLQHHFV